VVGPIACGRNGCSGFVVRCGGYLGAVGFLWEFRVFCWIQPCALWFEITGENVAFCWRDVVALWFFCGAILEMGGFDGINNHKVTWTH
jgi:hypothetical protein